MVVQIVAQRGVVRFRNVHAKAHGQMDEGEDRKYRQDDCGLERDLPTPIGTNYFEAEKQSAEGQAALEQLGGAITTGAIGMDEQLEHNHEEHRGEYDDCNQACELLDVECLGGRECTDIDEAEQLEEGDNREDAHERPGRQNHKMAGEHADRPEQPALIRVCIEVREPEIGNEGQSSGPNVAAPRDDG